MPVTNTAEAVSKPASILGSRFGLTSQEFNVGLLFAGLYSGEPGAWMLTDKGKPFATELHHENGYGGWAHRSWDTIKWLETVTAEMDLSEDGIARIRQFLTDRRRTQQAELKAARAAADAAFLASQAAKRAADSAVSRVPGRSPDRRVIVGLGVAAGAAGLYRAAARLQRRRKERAGAPEATRDEFGTRPQA